MNAVFLDHNSTTPLDLRVREAMVPWLGRPANPSSLHRFGRAARDAVEQARGRVAALVGADPSEVVFVSGGTESDNLALTGLLGQRPGALVVSAVEHAAVRDSITRLEREVIEVPVDHRGVLDLDSLEFALMQEVALVSVIWANNETGVLMDLPAVVERCGARGVPVHSDAVQAVGKVPVDFRATGLQLMSVSAHKLYGPQGIGALVRDRTLSLAGLIAGGGQEAGLRGGTEPVAAIVGFGVACELAARELEHRATYTRALRERLERGLGGLDAVAVLGIESERLPNTVQFTVRDVEGPALLMALDQAGFAVSSGSACASGRSEPSHVLLAMGVPPNLARGAVRVSLGVANTAVDVDGFLQELSRLLTPGSLLAGGGAMAGW